MDTDIMLILGWSGLISFTIVATYGYYKWWKSML